MKKLIILLAIVCFLSMPALAEEDKTERILSSLDLEPLADAVKGAGLEIDIAAFVHGLISGEAAFDLDDFFAVTRGAVQREWESVRAFLPGVLLPALLAALTAALARNGGAAEASQMLCCLACTLAEARLLEPLLQEARVLAAHVQTLEDVILPLLAGLLAASGDKASAAVLSPAAALAGRAGTELLAGAGVTLCAAAAAVAVGGNLSPRIRLKNLFALLVSTVNWGVGLLMTGFIGLLTVQGLLGASCDSASVRTARYAVDNLLPVIGGDVADSLDAVLSSLGLVKNALGVTGLIVILRVCAGPLLRMATALFLLKLAAAAMEPLNEERLASLTGQIAQVVQMILTLTVALAVLAILLIGAALRAGQGLVR